MQRKPRNGETVYLKAVRNTKQHAERHNLSAVRNTASVLAATRAIETLDLDTFIKVIGECRQQIKSAQQQTMLLAAHNTRLQAELNALTHLASPSHHLAQHLGHHDTLTGLPNRSLLHDRFLQAVSQAQRHAKPLVLIRLNLEDFKQVSNRLGQAGSDKLLQAVAARLTKGMRGADTACRYDGEAFVVMLAEIDSPDNATALAEEIRARLALPYIADGQSMRLAVSVGMAVYPGDGLTFDHLMQQADDAKLGSDARALNASVAELPKEGVNQDDLHTAPVPVMTERVAERDVFIRHASVQAPSPQPIVHQ